MAEKDITERILLAYNDVFADVVNGLLFKGQQFISPEDLVDQAPRASYKADGKIREIERDVAKRWLKNNIRIACVGLENQTEPDADMVLRVYGYDGAEYRSQLLKENLNNPRYPVVTLVLYFGYKKHWDEPIWLHDAIDIPDIFKEYVPNIKINLFEIAYMTREQLSYFHSDFRIVADYFIQKREKNDYVPSPDRLEHVEAVLQLLSVMTDDTRFEDILNKKDESGKEGGVHTMCDVLDRIEAKGEIKGAIKEAIRLYHEEMNLLPSEIEKKIMVRFSLSKAEAENYIIETLGVQPA